MPKSTTITIDTDNECVECGEKGSTQTGLCLTCMNKAVRGFAFHTAKGRQVAERVRKETAKMGASKQRGLTDPAPKADGKSPEAGALGAAERNLAKVKAKPPHIERKEIVKLLKCDLTEAELLQQGAVMAEAQQNGALAEQEFDSVKQQFKSKIEEQAMIAGRAGNLIRSKAEYRQVKCERILDFDKGSVREKRLDTDQPIETREMTDEERQMGLPLRIEGQGPE